MSKNIKEISFSKPKSIRKYRELCQKGSQENYFFDQLIARKISIYLTIPFIWMGVQPNQATFLSLISLLLSFYFFIFNSMCMLFTGTFLLFLYYLLDHVDGELARYYNNIQPKKNKSLDGQYFDILCHSFSGNIIIFFFGISAWKNFGYEWAILISFMVSVGMNRFPERVSNKIMIQAITNQPNILDNSSINYALQILEMKKHQIAAVQAPISDPTKWLKIAKEILGFPGLLILIMISAILDAIFSDFVLLSYSMNYRLLLVLFLFPIEYLRLFISSYKYFKLFKNVIIE